MILDSTDGGYLLVSELFDGDIPSRVDVGGVTISSTKDLAVISTLSTWSPLRVDLVLRHEKLSPRGAQGWETITDGLVDFSGPVRITDLEFDPHDGVALDIPPGRYWVQVLARSEDYVRARPPLQVDDFPTEQHLLFVSPWRG